MNRRETHKGSWYNEGDVDKLYIEKYDGVKKLDGVYSIVVPHAGYKYCSDVMCEAYFALKDIYDTVVILGTSHVSFKGC